MQIVIVGGDEVSYSNAPDDGRTWRQVLLDELGNRIDRNRIHLFGRIPHEQLQSSTGEALARIHLESLVLSWSLLEVMASGTPVLATSR